MSCSQTLLWLFLLGTMAAAVAGDQPRDGRFVLWLGPPLPVSVHDIPYLDAVTHVRVHRAVEGEYQFLHGASIIEHKGTLFASWANSPMHENSKDEVVRGRRSTDGGMTWGDVEVIAPGFRDTLERHSHAPFLSHKGELWAFASRWGIGEGERFRGLRVEAFVLDEKLGRWVSRGIAGHDCWPLAAPKRMDNGNWIVGGMDKDGRPAVLISHGSTLTKWDTMKLPVPRSIPIGFGETTLLTDGPRVVAIIRPRQLKRALVAQSFDFGRSWEPTKVSNLPMSDAKPNAGRLSNGQPYLVWNFPAKGMPARDVLVIATGKPGSISFDRLWKIRFGPSDAPRLPGRAKSRQWSYPYAHEHDGKLYVVYSIGKEDCGLSIIPLRALRWEPPPAGPPEPKLVAYYSCKDGGSGDLEDVSGHSNHGKLLGGAGHTRGALGPHALRFDGVDDVAEVPDSPSLDFSHATFSIAVWIKVATLGRGQQMIVAKNVYSKNQREWGLMIDKDDLPTLYFHQGNWRTVKARTKPTPGTWCHIAAVLDRGRGRIYVNGKLEGEAVLGTRLANTAAPLSIGGQRNAGQPMQLFLGAIDEIRLWSGALPPDQVVEFAKPRP